MVRLALCNFSSHATRWACLLLILSFSLLPGYALAQGEGPRVYPPAPVGTNVLSATWMDLESNMNFAGNILLPEADIQSTIYALNYNRYFAIGDRLAEIWATGIGGSVNGSADESPYGALSASVSGIADPYFAIRVGLLPSRTIADWLKSAYPVFCLITSMAVCAMVSMLLKPWHLVPMVY